MSLVYIYASIYNACSIILATISRRLNRVEKEKRSSSLFKSRDENLNHGNHLFIHYSIVYFHLSVPYFHLSLPYFHLSVPYFPYRILLTALVSLLLLCCLHFTPFNTFFFFSSFIYFVLVCVSYVAKPNIHFLFSIDSH